MEKPIIELLFEMFLMVSSCEIIGIDIEVGKS